VGGLSSSTYVGNKSESSEMKRVCDIAIGNSCNLALVVDNRLKVEKFTYEVRNLASIVCII
jgi:hypothetical protein